MIGKGRRPPNCLVLIVIAFLQALASSQGSGLNGKVTDANGKPIAEANVYGNSGKCCPAETVSTKTDPTGDFHLDRAGQVIHVAKEGFATETLVVKPGIPGIHVVLRASNDLNIPSCKKPLHGYRQIGNRVIFAVPKHGMKILGGKWDVDYVKYVITPSGSTAALELWFGPYALSSEPIDEQFINSADFMQRYVAFAGEGTAGLDSSGHFANGNS